jgi:hypothetical protein
MFISGSMFTMMTMTTGTMMTGRMLPGASG